MCSNKNLITLTYEFTDAQIEKVAKGIYDQRGETLVYSDTKRIAERLKLVKINSDMLSQAQSSTAQDITQTAVQSNKTTSPPEKIIDFLSDKKIFVYGGIAFVAALSGFFIYQHFSKKTKVEKELRQTLQTYLKSIKSGNLSLEQIDALIVCIKNLKKHANYEQISIKLTLDDLDVISNKLYDYTTKLAQANQYTIEPSRIIINNKTNPIQSLYDCLIVQKDIIKAAA